MQALAQAVRGQPEHPTAKGKGVAGQKFYEQRAQQRASSGRSWQQRTSFVSGGKGDRQHWR